MDIIEAFATKSKCYQAAIPLYPQGIMLHSIGCPPFKHCHFEVRASATGKVLDPTAYIGFANAVGVYDSEVEVAEERPQIEAPKSKLQLISIGPVSQGDADKIYNLCKELELTSQNLYKSEWVE